MKKNLGMRLLAIYLILVGLVCVLLSACDDPPQSGPKNGTVLIIRHAEKPPDGDPSTVLTAEGKERAQKYVRLLKAAQK